MSGKDSFKHQHTMKRRYGSPYEESKIQHQAISKKEVQNKLVKTKTQEDDASYKTNQREVTGHNQFQRKHQPIKNQPNIHSNLKHKIERDQEYGQRQTIYSKNIDRRPHENRKLKASNVSDSSQRSSEKSIGSKRSQQSQLFYEEVGSKNRRKWEQNEQTGSKIKVPQNESFLSNQTNELIHSKSTEHLVSYKQAIQAQNNIKKHLNLNEIHEPTYNSNKNQQIDKLHEKIAMHPSKQTKSSHPEQKHTISEFNNNESTHKQSHEDRIIRLEQICVKMNQQKQELRHRYDIIVQEKQHMLSQSAELQKLQYKLKNQISFMAVKNSELEVQVQQLYDIAQKNNQGATSAFHENSETFLKMETKFNDLAKQYSEKSKDMESLRRQLEELKVYSRHVQNNFKKTEKSNKSLTDQLKRMSQNHQEYRDKIQQILFEKEKQYEQNEKNKHLQERQLRDERLEREILRLNEENKNLKNENDQRKKDIQTLLKKNQQKQQKQMIMEAKNQQAYNLKDQLQRSQEHCLRQTEQKHNLIKQYEEKIILKDKVIRLLEEKFIANKFNLSKEEILTRAVEKNNKSVTKDMQFQQEEFNILIHEQTEQINLLRKKVSEKDQQMHIVQLQNEEFKNKLRILEQNSKVFSMNYQSNLNNLSQAKNVQQIMMKSEIEAGKKKIEIMSEKIKSYEKQIKQKDDFIRSQLINMTKKEEAHVVIDLLNKMASKY